MRDIAFHSQFPVKGIGLMIEGMPVRYGKYSEKAQWVALNKYEHMENKEHRGLFMTGLAQLKFLKRLRRVGNRQIYCDTDSVMFASKPGKPDDLVGSFSGNFSDDLWGEHFEKIWPLERSHTAWKWKWEQFIQCKALKAKLKNVFRRFEEKKIFGSGPAVVEAYIDLIFKRDSKSLTTQSRTLPRHLSCTFISCVIGQIFPAYSHGFKDISFTMINSPEL